MNNETGFFASIGNEQHIPSWSNLHSFPNISLTFKRLGVRLISLTQFTRGSSEEQHKHCTDDNRKQGTERKKNW